MAFTQNAPAKMRTLYATGRGGSPLGVRMSQALRVRDASGDKGDFDKTLTDGEAPPDAAAPKPGVARVNPTFAPRLNSGGTMTRGGDTTIVPTSQPRSLSPTMNSGGTISTGVLERSYAPSAYSPPVPRNNAGIPQSPAAILSPLKNAIPFAMPAPLSAALPVSGAPVASATTSNAQQTESANPLSGDGNKQPAGSTAPVNPGAALGISQRGNSVPRGQDALAGGPSTGGIGLYKRQFSDPRAASVYDKTVRRLSFKNLNRSSLANGQLAGESGSGASDVEDE